MAQANQRLAALERDRVMFEEEKQQQQLKINQLQGLLEEQFSNSQINKADQEMHNSDDEDVENELYQLQYQ